MHRRVCCEGEKEVWVSVNKKEGAKASSQTVEKGVLTPWPPLRGGSARRRWGRELYGCPKYFGLWQGSLPPPLRGTAPPLAQAPPPPYRGSLSRRGRFFDTLRGRESVLFFASLRHPRGESCRPQAADEGRICHCTPLMGNCGTLAPHPASGGASATFPRGGRLPYSSSSCSKISCATSPRLMRVSMARFSIRRWASVSV